MRDRVRRGKGGNPVQFNRSSHPALPMVGGGADGGRGPMGASEAPRDGRENMGQLISFWLVACVGIVILSRSYEWM